MNLVSFMITILSDTKPLEQNKLVITTSEVEVEIACEGSINRHQVAVGRSVRPGGGTYHAFCISV